MDLKKNRYKVNDVAFDTYEDALEFIRELRAFDKANQIPNRHYQIVVEGVEDYE